VSPAGGTLGDGERAIVTITADRSAAGRQVTVYPGGTVFTIVTSHGPRGGQGRSLPAGLGAATTAAIVTASPSVRDDYAALAGLQGLLLASWPLS
jgi:hypothetical protein